jgi:hypothetical protein
VAANATVLPCSEDASGGLFFLFFVLGFFDGHIAKFAGLEDFSAIDAFDILDIVFAGDDSDSWVFASHVH